MLPSRSDSRHLLSFQALPPDTETDIDTDKPTEPNLNQLYQTDKLQSKHTGFAPRFWLPNWKIWQCLFTYIIYLYMYTYIYYTTG